MGRYVLRPAGEGVAQNLRTTSTRKDDQQQVNVSIVIRVSSDHVCPHFSGLSSAGMRVADVAKRILARSWSPRMGRRLLSWRVGVLDAL